jgi:hypothetical protein
VRIRKALDRKGEQHRKQIDSRQYAVQTALRPYFDELSTLDYHSAYVLGQFLAGTTRDPWLTAHIENTLNSFFMLIDEPNVSVRDRTAGRKNMAAIVREIMVSYEHALSLTKGKRDESNCGVRWKKNANARRAHRQGEPNNDQWAIDEQTEREERMWDDYEWDEDTFDDDSDWCAELDGDIDDALRLTDQDLMDTWLTNRMDFADLLQRITI